MILLYISVSLIESHVLTSGSILKASQRMLILGVHGLCWAFLVLPVPSLEASAAAVDVKVCCGWGGLPARCVDLGVRLHARVLHGHVVHDGAWRLCGEAWRGSWSPGSGLPSGVRLARKFGPAKRSYVRNIFTLVGVWTALKRASCACELSSWSPRVLFQMPTWTGILL